MFQKGGPFVFRPYSLCLLVSLTLSLFDSLTLNVGFVYSLGIVRSTNYTLRNAREIREMYGLCRVLCIVCRVFLFPLLFMNIVVIVPETVSVPGATLHAA